MSKFLRCFILVLLLSSALIAPAWPVVAQGTSPEETTEASLPLTQLGVSEYTLRGPFDSFRVAFAVPADWELSGSARLHLVFDTFPGMRSSDVNASATLSGKLEVAFNGTRLSTILLDQAGRQDLTLNIPAEALLDPGGDRRHELSIFMESDLECDVPQQPAVVISGVSLLTLPYRAVAPPTDLTLLPYPLFQEAFEPDQAALIVPDRPSASELRAAMAVMAGFGRATFSEMNLEFLAASQLTEAVRQTHHLIFVGRASNLSLLRGAQLPATLEGDHFAAAEAQADDGVLQMVVSPWNPGRVILVVSGTTDAAVVKAGQALSTNLVRTGAQKNLAVVAAVQPPAQPEPTVTDRRLADLGYDSNTIQRAGSSTVDYTFFIPPGQMVQGGSYFDLTFAHSSLLSYERSALIVRLNDQPIGSARLSDASATLTTLRVAIPPAAVRPGLNRLTAAVTLSPRDGCVDPRLANLWLTISGDSLLHLPLVPQVASAVEANDLGLYPAPFVFSPTLEQLAVVVPAADPSAWRHAAQIVFRLGDNVNVTLFNGLVAFADDIPAEARQGHHWLIVGRPSQMPVLSELASVLPAPFEAGGDVATERGASVVYRLPEGTSVGYLELLEAPWDNQQVILAALGNSDEGLGWAVTALNTARLRSRLAGNFAVINGEQIITADTRQLPSIVNLTATAVPGGKLSAQPLGTGVLEVQRPGWILPFLAVSILLTLAVIAVVIRKAVRERRPSR